MYCIIEIAIRKILTGLELKILIPKNTFEMIGIGLSQTSSKDSILIFSVNFYEDC